MIIFPDSNLPDDSDITDSLGNTNNAKDTKDELTDILGSHFNIESIPNINSKDVEDIFKVKCKIILFIFSKYINFTMVSECLNR